MRYIWLASAVTFALCAGTICDAEEQKAKSGGAQTVVTEESGKPGLKHIDTSVYGNGEKAEEVVDQVGVMPRGKSYDRNTGLPNVVPSDAEGNIE